MLVAGILKLTDKLSVENDGGTVSLTDLGLKIEQTQFARALYYSNAISNQVWDSITQQWKDKLYHAIDPETGEAELFYDGKLTANVINAIKANIDIVVSNTVIVQNLYSQYGVIAELTVDELNTSKVKIYNYLHGIKSEVNYTHRYEEHDIWVTATYAGDIDGQDNKIQLRDKQNNLLYWVDDTHTGMTLTAEGHEAVYVYVYNELTKLEIRFETIDGIKTPMSVWGAGVGIPSHPDWGKAFMWKGADALNIKFISETGVESLIKMTEFVDSKHRRISNCAVNRSAGTISLTMEGETSPRVINFSETASAVTYTFPDGYTTTISIT